MTRANALVGALAALGVGTVLWCARLILAADLTVGTSVAAWGLWALVAAAVATLVLYARELGRHRHSVTGGGSWKPLPSLMLIWIGGATAVGVFLFMLPTGTASPDDQADPPKATPSATTAPGAVKAATEPRVSPTTVSRSLPRSTTPVVSPTSSSSRSGPRSTPRSTKPSRTSSTTTTPTSTTSSSSTTTPLVSITLPSAPGSPTTKPTHGH